MSLTKSELIAKVASRKALSFLEEKDVELAIKTILEQMVETSAEGERVEIRGFGSFSLHHRPPRIGRNPKTGETVSVGSKYVPHFKPGKELKERVNQSVNETNK